MLIVAVHHESYRPPTGLSTFPDGGRALELENDLLVYEVDAEAREARRWLRIEVPRRLWSVLSVAVVGVARDTAYVALSGCAGGERSRLLLQAGPRRPVQRPRDAAADPELRVGRVHDRVESLLRRDVADHELDRRVTEMLFDHASRRCCSPSP